MASSTTDALLNESKLTARVIEPGFEQRFPFAVLARFLERYRANRGSSKDKKQRRHALVRELFSRNRGPFFPLMRLLMPAYDKKRLNYKVKEKGLGELYVLALGLSKKSSGEAQQLAKYAKSLGRSFVAVLRDVLCNRTRHETGDQGGLSLADVNEFLDKLSRPHATTEQKSRALRDVMQRLSLVEHEWLARIILKESLVTEKAVLYEFHPDAEELYSISSDLEKVCTELLDPSKRITVQCELFKPAVPMLASSPRNLVHLQDLLKRKAFFTETKFDGERLQVHFDRDTNRFGIYSRNGTDMTFKYGALKEEFKAQLSTRVSRCIVDGEIAVYNEHLGRADRFGNLKTHANEQRAHQHFLYVIFDMLMVNGNPLLESYLEGRQDLLRQCIVDKPTYIEVVKSTPGQSTEDVLNALWVAMNANEEGIIIKLAKSPYVCAARGGHWIKLKPEMISGSQIELDMIVMGGSMSDSIESAYRKGRITRWYLGVAVAERDILPSSRRAAVAAAVDGAPAAAGFSEQQPPTLFYSAGKVGTGFNAEQLDMLQRTFRDKMISYRQDRPPPMLEFGTEKPDYWIDPRDSKLMRVRAAAIFPSKNFAAGLVLRFPVFQGLREDKLWWACETFATYRERALSNGGRLFDMSGGGGKGGGASKSTTTTTTAAAADSALDTLKRNLIDAAAASGAGKRRRGGGGGKRAETSVLASAVSVAGERLAPSDVVSHTFEGYEMYVANGNRAYAKTDIERLLRQHGATIVANPLKATTNNVIAALRDMTVRNLAQNGSWNVIHYQWVLDSVAVRQVMSLEPAYMLYTEKSTLDYFERTIDRYGDSFTKAATRQSLMHAFAKVDDEAARAAATHESKLRVDLELWRDATASDDDDVMANAELRQYMRSEAERRRQLKRQRTVGDGALAGDGGAKNGGDDLDDDDEEEAAAAAAGEAWHAFFRTRTLYFHPSRVDIDAATAHDATTTAALARSPLDIQRSVALFYGVKIATELDRTVSHIIVDRDTLGADELRLLRDQTRRHLPHTAQFIVDYRWIETCSREREDLAEHNFAVN